MTHASGFAMHPDPDSLTPEERQHLGLAGKVTGLATHPDPDTLTPEEKRHLGITGEDSGE